MSTKGFVLVMCLLFGLLCSALALAALTLTELSTQFNQAVLQQKQQALTAMSHQILSGSGRDMQAVRCPAQHQIWPETWIRCQIRRVSRQDLAAGSYGQVIVTWQIDPLTQGGEL